MPCQRTRSRASLGRSPLNGNPLGALGAAGPAVLIACVLLEASPTLRAAENPAPVTSLVQLNGKTLGWAGIFLGSTHADVETTLQRHIAIEPDEEALACGAFQSNINVQGYPVTIQWSDSGDAATVDSITLLLTPGEKKAGAAAVSSALQRRLPALKLVSSSSFGKPTTKVFLFQPVDNPGHALLLKLGAENVFFISLEGCLD